MVRVYGKMMKDRRRNNNHRQPKRMNHNCYGNRRRPEEVPAAALIVGVFFHAVDLTGGVHWSTRRYCSDCSSSAEIDY